MKEYKTCEEVLQALKNGKKVVGIGHLRRLCEGGIGCQEQKWYKVLYYYCNPQMNRTFAMLENGMSVDSNIDVLDFIEKNFNILNLPVGIDKKGKTEKRAFSLISKYIYFRTKFKR